ncbi:MAG: cytidine deaminase [Bacilli bacterium]|nr:cytidine deaminase [Bacilli bacterium]
MKDRLLEIAKNSYSPYSHFRVASILVMKDGKEFQGVNVENASYGAGICSERSAIVSAVSAGYTKGDFKELHVLCADSERVSTCCFICRQVITEFFDKDAKVYCYDKYGNSEEYTVSQLCPFPFDESDLNA